MRTSSRRLTRGLSCLALVAAAVTLGVPAAAAADVRSTLIKPDQTNWFWAEQTSGRENPVTHTGTPALSPDSSGIPRGDLGLSNAQGVSPEGPYTGPDKEPFVSWDLSSYYDVTVTAFKPTFFIDDHAQNLPPNAAPKLIACVVKADWGNGAGEDIQAKPKADCTSPVKATYNEKARSYTFDLTALAQVWANGDFNYGISLEAAPAEPEVQIALLRKDAAGLNKIPTVFTYTANASLSSAPTSGGVAPAAGSGTTDLGSGFSGGTVPAPADAGSLSSGTAPVLTAPEPAPAPAVVAPQTAPAAPIALKPLAVSARPSGTFWLAGLLLAGLLLFASLVLGARGSTATRREGGVNRALRTRGASGLQLSGPPRPHMI